MSITRTQSFSQAGGKLPSTTSPSQRTGRTSMHSSRQKKVMRSDDNSKSGNATTSSPPAATAAQTVTTDLLETFITKLKECAKLLAPLEEGSKIEMPASNNNGTEQTSITVYDAYKFFMGKEPEDGATVTQELINKARQMLYLSLSLPPEKIETINSNHWVSAGAVGPFGLLAEIAGRNNAYKDLKEFFEACEGHIKDNVRTVVQEAGGGGGLDEAAFKKQAEQLGLVKDGKCVGHFGMPAKIGIGAMGLGLLATLWAAITGNQKAEQLQQQLNQQAQGQQRLVSVLQQLAPALDQIQPQIQSIQQKASAQVRALANALSGLSQTVIATSSPPTSNMRITHSPHSMRSSAMHAEQPLALPAMAHGGGGQPESDDEAVNKAIQLSQQAQQALQQQASAKAAQPPPVSSSPGPAPSAQQVTGPSVYAPPWQQPPTQPVYTPQWMTPQQATICTAPGIPSGNIFRLGSPKQARSAAQKSSGGEDAYT